MNAYDAEVGKQIIESGKHKPADTNGEWVPTDEPPDVDAHHPGEYNPHTDGPADDDGNDDEPTTWEPVDLGPWLRGEIQHPTPTMGITRSDGLRLLYPGREHVVLGETESGKTWLALGCVVAELTAANHVVYIHYEEGNPGSTVEKLRLLGVADTLIRERLRFVAPARPVHAGWIEELLDPPPALVVHDGVNEAMSLHGTDIMAADGAATFRRRLVTPFLRAGAATIACDHVPKDREGRGRDAYGSVHKGNALDGARLLLENVAPFGRRMRGVSYVFVTKDRPGHLRAHGRLSKQPGKTFIGTLIVDDSQTVVPDFSMLFFGPQGRRRGRATQRHRGDCGPDRHRLRNNRRPAHNAVPSLRALYAHMRSAGVQSREALIRDAVDDLVLVRRLVETPGKRGATGYRAVLTAAQESDT